MQDTKFYLGIGIPKKGFGSSMPASDFRMICALLISGAVDLFSFYFSYLFFFFEGGKLDISEFYSLFHSNTFSIFSAWSFVYDAQQN